MASLAISAGTSLLKLGLSELTQHSARLQAAKSENAAIPPVVAAYDADLAAIVNAYNNGEADAATCIAALQQVDQAIYANLKGAVGAPGTAWSDSIGMTGACNRQCTAGCCVYFGDLGPPLSLAQIVLGGKGGAWGVSDPRLNGRTIKVPEVFASKYGGQDRPSYSITFSSAPPVINSTITAVQSTVDKLLGNSPAQSLGLSQMTQQGAAPQSSMANYLPWLLAFGALGFAFAISGRR